MENQYRMYVFRERWSKWYSAELSCIFKWLTREHGHFSLCLIHACRTVGSNGNVKTDQNTPLHVHLRPVISQNCLTLEQTQSEAQQKLEESKPPPRPNCPCKFNQAAHTDITCSFIFYFSGSMHWFILCQRKVKILQWTLVQIHVQTNWQAQEYNFLGGGDKV